MRMVILPLYRVTGSNLFEYCCNSPIRLYDPNGSESEQAIRKFFRENLKGYLYGLSTVLNAISQQWKNRSATEKALRVKYNIPASAKCEISYGVKTVTRFDRITDFITSRILAIIARVAGSASEIFGYTLDINEISQNTPDLGDYAGITYAFTYDYRVISGGDIDNHTGMECQAFKATWDIMEFTNGVSTYPEVTFDDNGVGQIGIIVDHCSLHS